MRTKEQKEKHAAYMREIRKQNPSYTAEVHRRLRTRRPWSTNLMAATQRCTNPNDRCYHRYGGRGIKMLLTSADVEFMWKRDGADKMIAPSIDRVDVDGHYQISNCRFIEMSENSRRRKKAIYPAKVMSW